ncbi:hypothetical protein ACHAXS_002524 [Conticribra weissflogii]
MKKRTIGKENSNAMHENGPKFPVFYYRKHDKVAVPENGVLKLNPDALSFRGMRGTHLTWCLDSINVKKFKGRINRGIVILGETRSGEKKDDEDEFRFTMVKSRDDIFEKILRAIDECKFLSEMESIKLHSSEALSENSTIDRSEDMSPSLLFGERGSHVEKSQYSRVLFPIHVFLAYMGKLASFIYKKITGRSLFLPSSMDEATLNLAQKVSQILTVSKITLSRTRQIGIAKEINTIQQSLMKMKKITRRECDSFTSKGIVVEERPNLLSSVTNKSVVELLYNAYSRCLLPLAIFLKRFSKRLYRPDIFYSHPNSVEEAVQNASLKVVDLVEVADETLSNQGKIQIEVEAKLVQNSLSNIQILSTVEIHKSSSQR